MPLLTKSGFKIGHECPTKLYYHNNVHLYSNKSLDDLFLQSLADGGFQVGELARKYYPSEHLIATQDHETALRLTNELLQQESVTIHEAAFSADQKLFVRADIVVKEGNALQLIEVKAKSFRSSDNGIYLKDGKSISSKWKPYVYDLAFQHLVVTKAFPGLEVRSYLLLPDKDKQATIEGLNQMFRIERSPDSVYPKIKSTGLTKEDLGEEILGLVDLTDAINEILGLDNFEKLGYSFETHVNNVAEISLQNTKVFKPVSKSCKGCEYVSVDGKPELRNGTMECLKNAFPQLSEAELMRPKFYEIANLKSAATEERFFMEDWDRNDIDPKSEINENSELIELSNRGRQWLQLKMVKEKLTEPVVLRESLKREIASFKYPFHFIDFETIVSAIPFNKGLRPYETIAFQFSHHIMHKDGTVEHADEWINQEQGAFPNFRFIRALKASLEKDSGTIFRYSAYENTILNQIKEQLLTSQVPDKEDLIQFTGTITQAIGDKENQGARNMVDLCEIVRKYYLSPVMNGRTSIKKVLPAVLHHSAFLREKYSKPVYGTREIPSRNFKNMTWLQIQNGQVTDPYTLLSPLFTTHTDYLLDQLNEVELDGITVGEGGAAMAAYAEMQFSNMPEEAIKQRIEALKRYCELDTLAMVMIMEEFINS